MLSHSGEKIFKLRNSFGLGTITVAGLMALMIYGEYADERVQDAAFRKTQSQAGNSIDPKRVSTG